MRFLNWLDQRDRHLSSCTQADLDTWHAQAADHHKRNLRAFLTWAVVERGRVPARRAERHGRPRADPR